MYVWVPRLDISNVACTSRVFKVLLLSVWDLEKSSQNKKKGSNVCFMEVATNKFAYASIESCTRSMQAPSCLSLSCCSHTDSMSFGYGSYSEYRFRQAWVELRSQQLHLHFMHGNNHVWCLCLAAGDTQHLYHAYSYVSSLNCSTFIGAMCSQALWFKLDTFLVDVIYLLLKYPVISIV